MFDLHIHSFFKISKCDKFVFLHYSYTAILLARSECINTYFTVTLSIRALNDVHLLLIIASDELGIVIRMRMVEFFVLKSCGRAGIRDIHFCKKKLSITYVLLLHDETGTSHM